VPNQCKNAGISAKSCAVAKSGEDGREAMHKWWLCWQGMFDIQTAKKWFVHPKKLRRSF
jgi:hypothetical protein